MIVFNGNKNNCKVPNKKVVRAHFEHGFLFYCSNFNTLSEYSQLKPHLDFICGCFRFVHQIFRKPSAKKKSTLRQGCSFSKGGYCCGLVCILKERVIRLSEIWTLLTWVVSVLLRSTEAKFQTPLILLSVAIPNIFSAADAGVAIITISISFSFNYLSKNRQ